MGKTAKPKANDWQARPLEDWNVTTFHAYLIDTNKEKYGTTYAPFGNGPESRRWSTEKGQLKQAITKHGNEVVKAFIDKCFESHRFNPEYPTLSFGFMWAYLRDNVARAELDVKRSQKRESVVEEVEVEQEIEEGWF